MTSLFSSVNRVTGPGRTQGRALEGGCVTYLMANARRVEEGVRMMKPGESKFEVEFSKEGEEIREGMAVLAQKLLPSVSREMRLWQPGHDGTDLSRRAFAEIFQSSTRR